MPNEIPPDVCRELICLILGDLRRFDDPAKPLGQGQIRQHRDFIVTQVRKSIAPQHKSSAALWITEKLLIPIHPLYMISQCLPSLPDNFHEHMRIRDEDWDDWLEICWGHDQDTLSILAFLPHATSCEELVNTGTRLPIIPLPIGATSDESALNDQHVHAGALGLPVLVWSYHMNTGFRYREDELNAQIHPNVSKHLRRQRLRNYLSIARVLLGALFDYSTYETLETEQPSTLLRMVVSSVEARLQGSTPKALADFLEIGLNISEPSKVSASVNPGVKLFDCDVIKFLRKERSCISKLIWQATHQQLGPLIEEVLLTYLRCKGHWFQVCSGLIFRPSLPIDTTAGLDLSLLKVCAEQSRLEIDPEDWARKRLLAHAINSLYRYLGSPTRVYVKLAWLHNIGRLNRTLEWLAEALASMEWRLVLCLRRDDLDLNEPEKIAPFLQIDSIRRKVLHFVDAVIKNERFKSRVVGIDVVGPEENFGWREYATLMKDVREYLQRTLKRDCFVAFHCGEETPFPLKGICDIWYVVENCRLTHGDRIAHGVDLLDPDRKSSNDPVRLWWWQWEEMVGSLQSMLHLIPEGSSDRNASEELFRALRSVERRQRSRLGSRLDGAIASKLAQCVRPYVTRELIKRGILLETCPTSNWRIAAVSFPTRHPVKYWIDQQGQYVVGTDDPAILPCTIQIEYYSVERSKTYSGRT